jgi:hypothetical protein
MGIHQDVQTFIKSREYIISEKGIYSISSGYNQQIDQCILTCNTWFSVKCRGFQIVGNSCETEMEITETRKGMA